MAQGLDGTRTLGLASVALSAAAAGVGLAWLVATAVPPAGRLAAESYRLGHEDATVHTLRRS